MTQNLTNDDFGDSSEFNPVQRHGTTIELSIDGQAGITIGETLKVICADGSAGIIAVGLGVAYGARLIPDELMQCFQRFSNTISQRSITHVYIRTPDNFDPAMLAYIRHSIDRYVVRQCLYSGREATKVEDWKELVVTLNQNGTHTVTDEAGKVLVGG